MQYIMTWKALEPLHGSQSTRIKYAPEEPTSMHQTPISEIGKVCCTPRLSDNLTASELHADPFHSEGGGTRGPAGLLTSLL